MRGAADMQARYPAQIKIYLINYTNNTYTLLIDNMNIYE
jgi:hypothetical protein